MDKVLLGGRLPGGFSAAGTPRHVSSVVRNLSAPGRSLRQPYRPAVRAGGQAGLPVSDRMAAEETASQRASFPTKRTARVPQQTATLHTTHGDIVINLHGDHAPKTVANFVGLASGT